MSDGTCGGGPDDWIPLNVAFSHAHAVEEARLGVQSPRGVPLLKSVRTPIWAPSSKELERLIRETRCIPTMDLAHERKKSHLTLSDIAASAAHRRLVSVFRAGILRVRAKATGTWLQSHAAAEKEEIIIPPAFWQNETPTSEVVFGPILDYATGTILDNAWDLSVMFSGRIDEAEIEQRHLLATLEHLQFPEISGGTFRFVGDAWEVASGGRSAVVAATHGMGFLAVLLTHPRTPVRWDCLFSAGIEAARGKAPDEWREKVFCENNHDREWHEGWETKKFHQENLESINLSIETLKNSLSSASPKRQLKIYEDIKKLEELKGPSQNAANRLDSPLDYYRSQVQHALRTVFRPLAVNCPDFVRHIGTYQERRALDSVPRANGIVYSPLRSDGSEAEVEWDTEPRR